MELCTDQRFEAELERDKRKWRVRRRMAVTSFFSLLVILLMYYCTPLIYSTEQAAILEQFNPIIITIVSALVGIILTYYGTVAYSDGKMSVGEK